MTKSKNAGTIGQELERAEKASRIVAEKLFTLTDEIEERTVKTKQRALTGVLLEQQIWKIWGHCRTNKDSLDSKRHCRIIRRIIDAAVAEVQRRIESMAVELKASEKIRREMKKEIRELKKQIRTDVSDDDLDITDETNGDLQDDRRNHSRQLIERSDQRWRAAMNAIEAMHEFWRLNPVCAVQWIEDANGRAIVFTRSEYRRRNERFEIIDLEGDEEE